MYKQIIKKLVRRKLSNKARLSFLSKNNQEFFDTNKWYTPSLASHIKNDVRTGYYISANGAVHASACIGSQMIDC